MPYTAGSRVRAADLNANSPQLLASVSGSGSSLVLAIPANAPAFNHLQVFWRARSTANVAAEQLYVQLNGDASSSYLVERSETNNTTTTNVGPGGAATSKIQMGTVVGGTGTGGYFASGVFVIGGAQDTGNFKTVQGSMTAFCTVSNAYVGLYAGQWNSFSAVTSVTFTCATGSFFVGSLASAYGIT